ncbi:basic-leucine zipper domain-containing protein [Tanacetum coccineum]|uniref:Basic-leucine zipper domain-containing protein n=1 Tax=Tanacetum coccineum TaxID=301880 RepID=A0ABQ5CAX9_9ASTR
MVSDIKNEPTSSSNGPRPLPREDTPLLGTSDSLSSTPKTFANVFIAIVGAGVLGLPYTFMRTGWITGFLMIFAVAGLVYRGMMLLIETRRKLESPLTYSKINSFGDLGFAVCGPIGRICALAMANSKGPSTMRSMMYNGKHSLLPPKSPFPSIAPSYADYVSSSAVGPKGTPKYRDGNTHQRTSSESFLIEEQPSWLDDLLNEPETPVKRGHRRSSSDSFTYMEAANAAHNEYRAQNELRLRNLASAPSWGSQEFDFYKDFRNPSFYADPNPMHKK